MAPTFILASASPRRKQLLEKAGFRFDSLPAEIYENRLSHETPQAYVNRLAREKAEKVARRHKNNWVLGADTIVISDPGTERETVLGKPRGPEKAARMLARLSGNMHLVTTAVALARMSDAFLECQSFSSTARVFFRALTPDEIEAYVETGEPLDKAGAYAIQAGASGFIERYEGSWSAIVGLPIEETTRELIARGLNPS